jgi:hypothetical protein
MSSSSANYAECADLEHVVSEYALSIIKLKNLLFFQSQPDPRNRRNLRLNPSRAAAE